MSQQWMLVGRVRMGHERMGKSLRAGPGVGWAKGKVSWEGSGKEGPDALQHAVGGQQGTEAECWEAGLQAKWPKSQG